MPQISPTAEGFRVAFRRPSLTLAEILWRWCVGATATALFFFGLFEYIGTLPVSRGEQLFLRTRQPYLIGQAIAHILRGSLDRAVSAGLLAALMIVLLWMIAGALGRVATVRWLLDYFRSRFITDSKSEHEPAGTAPTGIAALVRLNFLRVVLVVAVLCGVAGAAIMGGFASPDSAPQPGLAFLIFLALGAVVCFVGWAFNWFLSLAAMFAVRDATDAVTSISRAASFCRERTGAVFAVSTWTGLGHLIAFVGATTVVSMPLGLAGALPWRLVVLAIALITLIYFVVADWLYMARLAGYVCILEMPTPVLAPVPPPVPPAPVQTTIDRDELILSDVPNPS